MPPSSVNKQDLVALKVQSIPFQCQQTRTSGTESYDQNTMWPMVTLVQSTVITSGTESYDQNTMCPIIILVQSTDVT